VYPAWMVPPTSGQEPNPPYRFVVSFIRLHERGFTALASRFMRGLCYHYRVELHNSQFHIAGGHLRRRLRGAPGDPSELGSLGALVPRGAAHPCHGRDAGALVLTVKIRQPSHEFTFGVGISFIPYPLVLTPVV
jgi:hypothetical protein